MSASTSPKVTIGPGVQEFLQKKDAQAAFQTVCEIVGESFPQTLAIEARLEEDHDEAGWWRVVVGVTLPESIPADVWIDQHRRYSVLRADRVPSPQDMLFATDFEYQPG